MTPTPTPTPQQIIELAREAGIEVHERKEQARIGMDALLGIDSTPKLQRFATLLLERFGQTVVQQEPVAYAIFAENGNIRIWATEPQHVKRIAEEKGLSLVELYTHPAPAEVREPLRETEQIDAAMVATSHIFPPITRSQCQLIIRAAHGITGSTE